MNNIDFNNTQGSNLGDPKFGQDAVNLRTAKILIGNSLSNSSGITTDQLITTGLTASTAVIGTMSAGLTQTEFIQFIPINISPIPSPGLMFYDISNNLFIFTGSTPLDLVQLT